MSYNFLPCTLQSLSHWERDLGRGRIQNDDETVNKFQDDTIFPATYFRISIRKNPETEELSGYYRLLESYRNQRRSVMSSYSVECRFFG
jgi:hypothetical protein